MPIALLPRALTGFIGRERELATLRQVLPDTRLLTLTGAGGSGKTRLAIELAEGAGAPAVWVDLAPLQETDLVPVAVLTALDIEPGSRTAIDALVAALRGRALLLVLDNCEHLVDACARLAETLLQSCPELRILATSREALGVSGERAFLVPGLSLPAADATGVVAADSESVQLFVERARAASASFMLTEANAASIARICRRLDGLPLAIELAAARIRALPPEQLAARLDASLGVLAAGPRTAIPRHRTLRGAIQWSYDLLDAREARLLRRLSVFAGDFTLDAAEQVCSDEHLAADDILDTLGALVDKSLVTMREEGGAARYVLLETLRQFAGELLRDSGETPAIEQRHACAYTALVRQAEPHFTTRDRPRWVQRVTRELDNIRLALAYSRDHDRPLHLELAGMLGWFWYSSGLWSEGAGWLEGAVELPQDGVAPLDRARALLGAGVIGSLQARVGNALPWLAECIDIATRAGDDRTAAYARAYTGVAYGQAADAAAEGPTVEALAWFRESRDLYGVRLCLLVLSTVHMLRGDRERALRDAEEAVEAARTFGLDRELAIALQILATVVLTNDELVRAQELFGESLRALRRDPSLFWIARALQLLGLVTCRQGNPLKGARLLGAAEAIRDSMGAGLLPHDRDRLEPVVAEARQSAGSEAFAAAWREGRGLSLEHAFELALDGEEPAVGQAGAADQAPTTSTSRALEVHALGVVEILVNSRRVPPSAWRYTRPREVLLYLLAHPEGRTREQIGLVFWPDSTALQVKNSFHVSLHHLRKALGRSDLITFEGDRYRMAWELGVWFDAQAFESAMVPLLRSRSRGTAPPPDEAALGNALALYRGDFLAEEGAGDWHLPVRERLQKLCVDGLLMLAECQSQRGAHDEAVKTLSRLVATDPLHENAQRRLMTSMARAGDRSAALRQYERFARLLRSEMEAEPEGVTTALYRRLQTADPVAD